MKGFREKVTSAWRTSTETVRQWLKASPTRDVVQWVAIALVLLAAYRFPLAAYLLVTLLLFVSIFLTQLRSTAVLPLLLLTVLILAKPHAILTESGEWSRSLRSALIQQGGTIGIEVPGVVKVMVDVRPSGLAPDTFVTTSLIAEARKIGSRELQKTWGSLTRRAAMRNLITNGDFQIPLDSEIGGWGNGYYTDRIRQAIHDGKVFWLNFLNAAIDVSIEETTVGTALKIAHKSVTKDHSVGIVEQYMQVPQPGWYRFSVLAKAEDVADAERASVIFTTRDDWHTEVEIEGKNINTGFSLASRAPFPWQRFSKDIWIEHAGQHTFSIVSTAKRTIYLADISLTSLPPNEVHSDDRGGKASYHGWQ